MDEWHDSKENRSDVEFQNLLIDPRIDVNDDMLKNALHAKVLTHIALLHVLIKITSSNFQEMFSKGQYFPFV